MKRAAIVMHLSRDAAAECGLWLVEKLQSAGVEVYAAEATGALGSRVPVADEEELASGFDLMFALGGDGTFLRAAELAAPSLTPLLGVNLGRIGFLAAVERVELEPALERILREGVRTEDRMTLEGEIVDASGAPQKRLWALNDVSISKLEPGRLIKLGVKIGGEPLAGLAADGIVIASPTGSTAYSFSSGGPIVSPGVDCMIVTPVSPHLFFDRSVIVPPSEEIEISVLPDPDAVAVSADGRGWTQTPPGTVVRVRPSPKRLRVATLDRLPFWRLVRSKFRLPELPG